MQQQQAVGGGGGAHPPTPFAAAVQRGSGSGGSVEGDGGEGHGVTAWNMARQLLICILFMLHLLWKKNGASQKPQVGIAVSVLNSPSLSSNKQKMVIYYH